VTRAFGDHRWKWDNDFIKQVQYKFWGTSPRPNSKMPPYMDAEPEITETDIVRVDPAAAESGKSDFMIMASDGLWDHISSAHAVDCVSSWLEARVRGNGRVSDDPQLVRPLLTNSLQLDPGVDVDPSASQEVTWKATPEYFAIEDDNAAVCLARNAMGGTRRGLFMGLFTIPGPMSRNAVDDITIMVVFFDKVAEGGKKKKKSGKIIREKSVTTDAGERKRVGFWWPSGGGK
jgi:pyruvate dehydrogenase phosphatase